MPIAVRNLCFAIAVVFAAAGCTTGREQPQMFTLFFNYNSAAIAPEAQPVVREAAELIKRTRPASVQVAGYTGNEEVARTDDELAAQRFTNVENALVAEGVPRDLLARVSLNDPVPLPATAVRRIEIRLVPAQAVASP